VDIKQLLSVLVLELYEMLKHVSLHCNSGWKFYQMYLFVLLQIFFPERWAGATTCASWSSHDILLIYFSRSIGPLYDGNWTCHSSSKQPMPSIYLKKTHAVYWAGPSMFFLSEVRKLWEVCKRTSLVLDCGMKLFEPLDGRKLMAIIHLCTRKELLLNSLSTHKKIQP
jgi:hypothetical protein